MFLLNYSITVFFGYIIRKYQIILIKHFLKRTGNISMVPGGPGRPSAPGKPGRPGGP